MARPRNTIPYRNKDGSWAVRVRIYDEERRKTEYTPRSGFKDEEEARRAGEQYEEEYERAKREVPKQLDGNMLFGTYLVTWLNCNLWPRPDIAEITKALGDYAINELIRLELKKGNNKDIPVNALNKEYLNKILDGIFKDGSVHKANTARFYIKMALNDGVLDGLLKENVAIKSKSYPRKKHKSEEVIFTNDEEIRTFLREARKSDWNFEIHCGLFLGLRKGEILGLKISDFDLDACTVDIRRQITANPKRIEVSQEAGKGMKGRYKYEVIEKDPKSDSKRRLKCPKVVMEELKKRIERIEKQKKELGEEYFDGEYLSCRENGLPHNVASLNKEITNICKRANLPKITPHSLRKMFGTMLLEQKVALPKVSAMLGHSSINTTFEWYAYVIKGFEEIDTIVNEVFPGGE